MGPDIDHLKIEYNNTYHNPYSCYYLYMQETMVKCYNNGCAWNQLCADCITNIWYTDKAGTVSIKGGPAGFSQIFWSKS